MTVEDWFSSGCEYSQGVMLYAQLKNSNKHLLRLFTIKESSYNLEKLKHELGKHKPVISESSIIKQSTKTKVKEESIIKATMQSNDNNSNIGFYQLNQLPKELHPLSIEQRNSYQLAIASKLALNNLNPIEEGEALKLCIKIESLFDFIESTQKILKHYVDHKVVINTSSMTYEDLTPAQLLQRRNNKRSSITKYNKRLEKLLVIDCKNFNKHQQSEYNRKLQKLQQKVLEYELEIEKLNQLIQTK